MALSEWTEPYYKAICERYALTAFESFELIGTAPTITELLRCLRDPYYLGHFADQLDHQHCAEVDQLVATILSDERQR